MSLSKFIEQSERDEDASNAEKEMESLKTDIRVDAALVDNILAGNSDVDVSKSKEKSDLNIKVDRHPVKTIPSEFYRCVVHVTDWMHNVYKLFAKPENPQSIDVNQTYQNILVHKDLYDHDMYTVFGDSFLFDSISRKKMSYFTLPLMYYQDLKFIDDTNLKSTSEIKEEINTILEEEINENEHFL